MLTNLTTPTKSRESSPAGLSDTSLGPSTGPSPELERIAVTVQDQFEKTRSRPFLLSPLESSKSSLGRCFETTPNPPSPELIQADTQPKSYLFKCLRNIENDANYPGCKPKKGPFMETVISRYFQLLKDKLSDSQKEKVLQLIIPETHYVQFEETEGREAHFGSSQEFIQNAEVIHPNFDYQGIDSLSLELLAVGDMLAFLTDRHYGNILKIGNSLIPIDNSDALPEKAEAKARFFWNDSKLLSTTPSNEIKEFIKSLDPKDLEEIGEMTKNEILSHKGNHPDESCISLSDSQLLTHTVSLIYLKEALDQGLSLSTIGSYFCLFRSPIKEICEKISDRNQHEKIRELCIKDLKGELETTQVEDPTSSDED